MKITALLLAAVASATVAQAASAQTNTTGATPSAAVAPPAASVGTAPPQAPPGAPMSSPPASSTPSPMAMATPGPFRPITPAPGADIVGVLQASGQFTTLLKVADATSLTQVLKTQPGITVLAPTDAAFAALPPSALDLKDPANLAKLQALLTYHVINARLPTIKGHSATAIETVATGKKVTLDGSGAVKVNDATALQSPVTASNGVIYPIDKVLSPDYIAPPAPAAEAATSAADAAPAPATSKKSSKKKR